jgi:hypothetical protein
MVFAAALALQDGTVFTVHTAWQGPDTFYNFIYLKIHI